MNSLIKKLILPISLSIFSLTSQAQGILNSKSIMEENKEVKAFLDSLPENFKYYKQNGVLLKDTLFHFRYLNEMFFQRNYDVDKDGIEDVIELISLTYNPSSHSIDFGKNPIAYFFKLKEGQKLLFDPKENKINYDEELYEFPKRKPTKI